ncbi:hypothetical protein GMRT_12618 [Giardia muris]|uniref:Uncharacterized protein n=1 Tax=Giardia muris TaxID=5742 RepID=A0A4Z1SRJ3_GIAMU|nr:hypothetical protein GMRT_12618 [Giardia muris]|eukprot:TNJ28486.1 hypothetical protein GMRT_12618 [Giardia muris]
MQVAPNRVLSLRPEAVNNRAILRQLEERGPTSQHGSFVTQPTRVVTVRSKSEPVRLPPVDFRLGPYRVISEASDLPAQTTDLCRLFTPSADDTCHKDVLHLQLQDLCPLVVGRPNPLSSGTSLPSIGHRETCLEEVVSSTIQRVSLLIRRNDAQLLGQIKQNTARTDKAIAECRRRLSQIELREASAETMLNGFEDLLGNDTVQRLQEILWHKEEFDKHANLVTTRLESAERSLGTITALTYESLNSLQQFSKKISSFEGEMRTLSLRCSTLQRLFNDNNS